MKRNNIIGIVIALSTVALLLGSCHREKPITSEIGKPLYEIKDGNHPADHAIYELYKKTGIQTIYNFDPKIAKWDLGALSSSGQYVAPHDNEQATKDNIAQNLEYILKDFVDLYPLEFKQKFMPLRIYLCDSIIMNAEAERMVWYGRDHIAINLYKDGEKDYDQKKVKDPITKKMVYPPFSSMEEYYAKATQRMHSILFTYLSQYRVSWPQSFLTYCAHMYGENFPVEAEKEPNFDPRSYGFWSYDEMNTFKYYRAIKEDQDITDFVERMIGYTEAENLAAMEGFPELKAKYNILRDFIKENFNVDLQEIGNKKK